jgi:hypothetical protein
MNAPVDVARAALCEAGRPDMAERVRINRAGFPSSDIYATRDQKLLVRAFWLAHITVHPPATIDDDGLGITCPVCWNWHEVGLL